MRAVLILCTLGRVAAADERVQLAETRDCREMPPGLTTQLVGDRLFVLRDDGLSSNALWVIQLAPAPRVVERFSFHHMNPRAFRVVGDRLFIVGALPPTPPPDGQAQLGWTMHPSRVLVLDARDFSYEPHENAAGYPACDERVDAAVPAKAARGGEITVVAVGDRQPWPGEMHLVVMRGQDALGEIDHRELELENLRSFCSTLPPYDRDHACGAAGVAKAQRGSRYDFLAIRWGTLLSVSTAGVAVHDLTTRELLGGVSTSELQAMLPTISLK
ncbi:MAG: hypothetical protein JO257_01300 [Deltaproteobacteria bacterium]|nr:hypothetical protein [Deltaproteobacteria bacterium]